MTQAQRIDADAYPLYWPETWPRTAPGRRAVTARYKVTFVEARDRLLRQLVLFGARKQDIIISTNVPIRNDGLPRADFSAPDDPGVAVYWLEKNQARVIACDHWKKVRDNMRAAGLAIEALRSLKRSGATQVIDRAFAGFAALPANAGARPWREVLELTLHMPNKEQILSAYLSRVRDCHPDTGGSHAAMAELNAARDAGLRDLP